MPKASNQILDLGDILLFRLNWVRKLNPWKVFILTEHKRGKKGESLKKHCTAK